MFSDYDPFSEVPPSRYNHIETNWCTWDRRGKLENRGQKNMKEKKTWLTWDSLLLFFFFFSRRAHKLCSAFLRSLISPKEISPGETHSHADGTFPPTPLSLFLSRSIRPFRAPLRPLCLSLSLSFAASLPSYIKQTVSLAALGDIALIFQHSGTGVMQCAAMDTLHEDLSLLKWAKSGRASLSGTGIYLRGTFLISGLYWRNPSRHVFPYAWHAAQIGCLVLVDLADIVPPRSSIGCSREELGLVTAPPKIVTLLI